MGQIIISILALLVWITSYWVDTSILGYSDTSKIYTRLTYIFAHSSFWHMIMNVITLNLLMSTAKKIHLKLPLLVSYISAVIGTVFATYSIPTVGLSGVCFALLGAILVKVHNKEFLIAVGIVLITQTITFMVNSNVNVLLHISSLIIGFIINYFLHYDYKRTKASR